MKTIKTCYHCDAEIVFRDGDKVTCGRGHVIPEDAVQPSFTMSDSETTTMNSLNIALRKAGSYISLGVLDEMTALELVSFISENGIYFDYDVYNIPGAGEEL